ncbi:S9 family peptidase [Gracilimonas mengyeensis]|uniref:Dipeptidyl aminopeptidase/acylaminoacyl peptidase n=1 Tax=Gracilimonas mengyeensis TaxID=1302730 RepID=A0A521BU82_9BACT|nr:prolyl oligopeptidase family serine peptidase [Gracilimonas mengyeensis]SMO50729.1 Dipeptidyl aminopeptidase/acylaminoacyl peptidase [Gracilimonas mengyeensis]
MKKLFALLVFIVFAGINVQAQQFPEALTMKDIFHEPFIPGTRPSFSHFSPDGRTVYFQWSDSATSDTDLFQVGLTGKNQQEAPDDIIRNYELSPDGKHVLYTEKGDLVLANTDFENKRIIVATKDPDYSPVWNADGSRFAFVKGGDIWVSGVNQAFIKQITRKKEDAPNYDVETWAGDKLVLIQRDESDYREYYFPEYADTYVKPGGDRRGIPTQIVSIAPVDSGEIKVIFNRKGYVDIDASASGKHVALDYVDPPMKNRQIIVYKVEDYSSKTLFEDQTEGWMYGTNMEFAPATDRLMFQSEKDGWNHLYTINPDGTGFEQHTFGEYDIPWARWIDERTIVMATSEMDRGEIQLSRLDIITNMPVKLTTEEGYRRDFELSHDRRYVVYEKTFFNEPFDLHLVDTKIPKRETKLTNSVPESFFEYNWQQEEFVRFNSRDGKTRLSMSVLRPARRNPAGNPVVVFVHGAGSLQNVYKGWSNSYWREYLFHQYLTLQGYYVIEVDYRHSTGYGRKFREDVTGWMGKYETQDIEDGLAFLTDNFPKADTSRVGIYGGSYGGFMALYAVSVSPERFDAAAALRSVTNWENYYYTNPWYTLPRLGTPERDSVNYARSSPITYADSLERPVLLLHGLIDDNVGFQDVAQYIEKLVQSGNEDFELMIYPTERHSFRDEDAWYDEYRRIYEFFERELKP